jgi:hypothetical protein
MKNKSSQVKKKSFIIIIKKKIWPLQTSIQVLKQNKGSSAQNNDGSADSWAWASSGSDTS